MAFTVYQQFIDKVSFSVHLYTIFHQINTPGEEAQNKPSPLYDFHEIDCVNSSILGTLSAENLTTNIGSVVPEIKLKVGGTFIQAGTFIWQNMVC